jgi:hypothetical protein
MYHRALDGEGGGRVALGIHAKPVTLAIEGDLDRLDLGQKAQQVGLGHPTLSSIRSSANSPNRTTDYADYFGGNISVKSVKSG